MQQSIRYKTTKTSQSSILETLEEEKNNFPRRNQLLSQPWNSFKKKNNTSILRRPLNVFRTDTCRPYVPKMEDYGASRRTREKNSKKMNNKTDENLQ